MTPSHKPPQDFSPLEQRPVVRALLRLGYVLEWRDEGEGKACSVSDPDETWEGRGTDESSAFDAALHALAPSQAAKDLLVQSVRERRAEEGSREQTAQHAATGGTEGARDRAAVLSDLQLVAGRVEAGIPEAALMAPQLQKLHVLSWIARARTLEQELPRDREAAEQAGLIARRLTALCKTWWPGSVRALQLDATAERSARDQGLPGVSTWLEVASAAEARLEQWLADPLSDDGWRDVPALDPAPDDVVDEVDFAVTAIERHVSPLSVVPTGDAPVLAPATDLLLQDAAGRLRWSRPCAPDPERWGAAVGRLRWLAAQKGGGPRLARLLEPSFCPRPNWESEARSSQGRLANLDAPPDAPGPLLVWLVPLFEMFDTPGLASRLSTTRTAADAEVIPLVLALKDADVPERDRRVRRRLKLLQDALRARLPDAGGGDRVDPALQFGSAQPGASAPGPHEDPAIAPRRSHDDVVFAAVRAARPEAHALFVSNREDPTLKEKLEGALGWTFEWSTAEPRRISAVLTAISHGRFHVVLSATGFQDHSIDVMLARASSASHTLYVRVNRGRASACARALARELGIRPDELLA